VYVLLALTVTIIVKAFSVGAFASCLKGALEDAPLAMAARSTAVVAARRFRVGVGSRTEVILRLLERAPGSRLAYLSSLVCRAGHALRPRQIRPHVFSMCFGLCLVLVGQESMECCRCAYVICRACVADIVQPAENVTDAGGVDLDDNRSFASDADAKRDEPGVRFVRSAVVAAPIVSYAAVISVVARRFPRRIRGEVAPSARREGGVPRVAMRA